MLLIRRISDFIATLLGVGHIPFMPGTFGTIVATLVYITFPEAWFSEFRFLPYSGAALLILGLLSVYVSTQAEKSYGKDASVIIIDDFVGYFVAIFLMPRTLWIVIYSFVLYRVFDIAKPFPINRSQNLPRGWGVVVDDVIAGIFTNVLLQVLIKAYPQFFGVG